MKVLFLTLTLIAFSLLAVRAQNGASVTATGTVLGPFGKEVQLAADYKVNRFSLGLGLSYLSSAYRKDSLSAPYPEALTYNRQLDFRHVMASVNFGYHIPVGNRFFVIPMATIGVSYNISAKYMAWSDQYENLYQRKLTRKEFDENYRNVSLWGGLALRFSYRASDRINILAAIHGKGTVTALNKTNEEAQRSSSGGITLGFQYNFSVIN